MKTTHALLLALVSAGGSAFYFAGAERCDEWFFAASRACAFLPVKSLDRGEPEEAFPLAQAAMSIPTLEEVFPPEAAAQPIEEISSPPDAAKALPAEGESFAAERLVFYYKDDEGNLHAVTGMENVPAPYRSRAKIADGKKLYTYKSKPVERTAFLAVRPPVRRTPPSVPEEPPAETHASPVSWESAVLLAPPLCSMKKGCHPASCKPRRPGASRPLVLTGPSWMLGTPLAENVISPMRSSQRPTGSRPISTRGTAERSRRR